MKDSNIEKNAYLSFSYFYYYLFFLFLKMTYLLFYQSWYIKINQVGQYLIKLRQIYNRALILLIQTSALYKSFTYLQTLFDSFLLTIFKVEIELIFYTNDVSKMRNITGNPTGPCIDDVG